MAKTKILQKLRIDEVSAVRGAANPEAWVKMVKRDTPQTREQQLQNAADRYTAAVSKSAAAAPTTEFQAYQKRLYEAPTPVTEPVSAPFPAGYSKLMKMAKRLAATQPVLSVEQHFAKLCEDPRNAEHFQKATQTDMDPDVLQQSWYQLGTVLRRMHRPQEAQQAFAMFQKFKDQQLETSQKQMRQFQQQGQADAVAPAVAP